MSAALYLHSLLSLKLDARDAYKLAHDYRAEELHKAADELERTADEVEAIVAAHYGPESGIGPGSAEMLRMAGRQVRDMAGKDTGGACQAPAGESTQPTGPFERVTVYLTPASSAALIRAVETIGDSKTDTINRAIQTYALMAGQVADGGRVFVQHAGESTQPAPARVWHVFDEDTAHATPRLYVSEEAARLGTIARYEEMEGVCPDYSWRPDDDVWELLAGGEQVGIYFAPVPVTADDAPAPFVPRTEREYWVAIADALNACLAVGMPVGIDLDGTLTDHNAWSVVWNRQDEKWEVAGYDVDADGVYADVPDAEPNARVQESAAKLRALLAGGIGPDTDRVIAYRSRSSRVLRCLNHLPTDLTGLTPVTSDDLHDGGICTFPDCGADVLTATDPITYADTRGEPGSDLS